MHSGEMLVVIPKVVFAELRSCVALLLQEVSDCRRPVRNSVRGPREADGKQSSSEWVLPQNERRTARSTALLSIGVSEERSLFRQAVDVGGSVTHHSEVVGSDIAGADAKPRIVKTVARTRPNLFVRFIRCPPQFHLLEKRCDRFLT